MLRSLARSLKRVGRALAGEVPMMPKPEVLYRFDSQAAVDTWHVFSDAYFGGRSAAAWRLLPDQSAAEFSGRCSTDMEDGADLARAGYCAATSKVTAIGDYFDLESYSHVVYTLRGDGHAYMANIRVDSMAGGGGDVWQAPFTTSPSPGWTDVRIPLSAFVMTSKGRLVERRMEMPKDRVIALGVSFSALASPDPRGEAAAGIRQRPVAGGGGGGGGAAGAGGRREGGGGAAAGGGEAGADSGSDEDGAQEHTAAEFMLLLREIRAEGRAGVGPPEQ
ncbi:MAG: complex I intermediate-associated protein 30-domain-containing protein [Monoraphidium minutum]|nr:MAG: complex I intermediate-associated protein 30-domain-containing protein [Monoraphidium minutum]